MTRCHSDVRRTGWAALAVIVLLGALQVWRVGAYPNADGISYLDLSDAALAGNWHEFVNAYWSPLFPALIAVGRAILGASPDLEAPVIAFVNAVAAVVAAACFADILQTLGRRGTLPIRGKRAVATHIVCWSAFAAVVLRIVPLTLSSPDLLVVACQLAALAAMLRLREATQFGRLAFAVGAALGVGFLAKGAVLVLSASYLVALALLVPRARLARAMVLALVGFNVVAAPWIAVLSMHEGTITVGSVARLNLAWYVGGQSSQTPDPDAIDTELRLHRWTRVGGIPEIYDFSPHAVGTYPPWTDPSWSHEGIVPRPTFQQFREVLKDGATLVWSVFGVSVLVWLILLAGGGTSIHYSDVRLTLALAVLAAAQLGVYWPVHFEVRFLGIAWLYAWLAIITMVSETAGANRARIFGAAVAALTLYAAITPAIGSPREMGFAVIFATVLVVAFAKNNWRTMVMFIALTASASAPWCASIVKGIIRGVGPTHQRDTAIVNTLHDAGVYEGAALGSVNATFPASWARLGRWHIIVEIAKSRSSAFWHLDDAERSLTITAMERSHVAAVVGILDDGSPVPVGWIVVPGTNAVILPVSRTRR